MWVDLLKILPISLQLSPGWGRHHLWALSIGLTFPWQLWKVAEVCWTRQFPSQGTSCVYTIGAHFLLLAFVRAVSSDMGWILLSFTAVYSRYTTQLKARPMPITIISDLLTSDWPPPLCYIMWSIMCSGSIQTKLMSGFSIVFVYTCMYV